MSDIILTTFHPGQQRAFCALSRFSIECWGRRAGKTEFLKKLIADTVLNGEIAAYYAPTVQTMALVFNELATLLAPVEQSCNRSLHEWTGTNNSRIDFWPLSSNILGRGRSYDLIVIDEAAHHKRADMLHQWRTAIRPTLSDRRGCAVVASTPDADDGFFNALATDPKEGFTFHHAPSSSSPYFPADELREMERTMHPLVFQQEILAQFVNWSGVLFFKQERMLVGGQPILPTPPLGAVFACIDTAQKSGPDHDGQAVVYWGLSYDRQRLYVLDWDVISIHSADLPGWLPSVFERLTQLAQEFRAANNAGAFIEDTGAGISLIVQAQRQGFDASAITSGFTALGKTNKAKHVLNYYHQQRMLVTPLAWNKEVEFHGTIANHWKKQVLTFVGNDPGEDKREDDLFDAWVAGPLIAFEGNDWGV